LGQRGLTADDRRHPPATTARKGTDVALFEEQPVLDGMDTCGDGHRGDIGCHRMDGYPGTGLLCRGHRPGRYQRGDVHYTIAPSMDIQVASNFERYLYYHLGEDSKRLRAFMEAFARTGSASLDGAAGPVSNELIATAVDEAETLATIKRIYERNGYVADPHTAIGLAAAERFETSGTKICIATAHPAKFPESVNRAIGKPVARHPTLEALAGLESRRTVIPATLEAVRGYLEQHAR